MSLVALINPPVLGGFLYSNNNLTLKSTDSVYSGTYATVGRNTGKWYWEVYIESSDCDYGGIGVACKNNYIDGSYTFGAGVDEFAYLISGKKCNSYIQTIYGPRLILNDTLGILLDLDNNTIEFKVNDVSYGEAFKLPRDKTYFPGFNIYRINKQITFNFGVKDFKYSIPAGFNPYDIDNSTIVMYLIKNGNSIYSIKNLNSIYELVLTQIDSQTISQSDFKVNGFNNIKLLTTDITNENGNYKLIDNLSGNVSIFMNK